MSNPVKFEAEIVLAELGVSEKQAIDLLIADVKVSDAQAKVKELRQEFIALLPTATDAQFDALTVLVRKEEAVPEGLRVNADFRLTATQEEHLETVRQERAAYCEANAAKLLEPVLTDVTQKLRSFKVRQSPKKIVTTARWEKSVAVNEESRSLIARLARATLA